MNYIVTCVFCFICEVCKQQCLKQHHKSHDLWLCIENSEGITISSCVADIYIFFFSDV